MIARPTETDTRQQAVRAAARGQRQVALCPFVLYVCVSGLHAVPKVLVLTEESVPDVLLVCSSSESVSGSHVSLRCSAGPLLCCLRQLQLFVVNQTHVVPISVQARSQEGSGLARVISERQTSDRERLRELEQTDRRQPDTPKEAEGLTKGTERGREEAEKRQRERDRQRQKGDAQRQRDRDGKRGRQRLTGDRGRHWD